MVQFGHKEYTLQSSKDTVMVVCALGIRYIAEIIFRAGS